jgi:hypothetical protein
VCGGWVLLFDDVALGISVGAGGICIARAGKNCCIWKGGSGMAGFGLDIPRVWYHFSMSIAVFLDGKMKSSWRKLLMGPNGRRCLL